MNNINYFERQNFDTVIIRKIPNFLFNMRMNTKSVRKNFFTFPFSTI